MGVRRARITEMREKNRRLCSRSGRKVYSREMETCQRMFVSFSSVSPSFHLAVHFNVELIVFDRVFLVKDANSYEKMVSFSSFFATIRSWYI